MRSNARVSTLLFLLCATSLVLLLVDAKKRKKNPKCPELVIRDAVRYGCSPPFTKGKSCFYRCERGCRRRGGARKRTCKIRPTRWIGGRGLDCACQPPCTSAPPDVPNTMDEKTCTPPDPPYRSTTVCLYHCIPGYWAAGGQSFKQCVSGTWIGVDLVCDTDDCPGVNCQNGGICIDGINSYSCHCLPGYEGDHCETSTYSCYKCSNPG
ncbi:uncharacterized protein LOC144904729 [Branchiostoma floridae x Branchiostoma belcheri]